jgi:hypothetical protein
VFKVKSLNATDSAERVAFHTPFQQGRIGPLHSYLVVTPVEGQNQG